MDRFVFEGGLFVNELFVLGSVFFVGLGCSVNGLSGWFGSRWFGFSGVPPQ